MRTPTRRPRSVYDHGDEPDVRFSLANERTLLAWLRTALALLIAGIAVHSLRGGLPATSARVAATTFCALACVMPVAGYLRWLRNERALRTRRPLSGAGLTTALIAACTAPAVVVLVELWA